MEEDDLHELWLLESERRWNEIEAGDVQTIPWEVVREKLLNQA